MKRLGRTVGRQFGRPHGPLGLIAARLMRGGNAPLNRWMVDLLEVEPGDRVLEVGFGPGVALAELLARASGGFVVGVDASGLMVRKARSRHGTDVAAGRLEIHQGDAGSLPYDDATFDKACAANVIYFWLDAVGTVRELRRVLRPGGTVAVAYLERERMPASVAAALSQGGARLFGPGEVEQVVRAAGFEAVRVETRMGPNGPAGFCALAVK
jgi:ubiquinone/menaquinone biosynthesis C-methylase UbiE